MNTVRFGIIGVGGMGMYHVNYFDTLENAKITAVCDTEPKALDIATAKVPTAKRFDKYQDLINSGEVDAVLVATPHYQHPEITIAALEKGLHVLCEKPEAVTVREARRMNEAAAKYPKLKFGINFQMRTSPALKKIRQIVQNGDLGQITRITWIVTTWFRTYSYYASGGWRATWAGEGGGVLINQCPHNLDQLHWLTGMMPKRITAVAYIGKTHPIEVEDEVSAILEYENGAIGHFMTTTGEAPGTDRLEIAGDRGKLVSENGVLTFRNTRASVREFRENDPGSFSTPETWDINIPIEKGTAEAKYIAQNFINAILKDEPLISPGPEGAKGLEIGNAMLMAGVTRQPVDLPLDADAYDAFLKDVTKKYGGRKTLGTKAASSQGDSFSASFGRKT